MNTNDSKDTKSSNNNSNSDMDTYEFQHDKSINSNSYNSIASNENISIDTNVHKSNELFESSSNRNTSMEINEYNELNKKFNTLKERPKFPRDSTIETLKILRFENPSKKNLCFSNVTTTLVLNLKPLQQYLFQSSYIPGNSKNIVLDELLYLNKQYQYKHCSTQNLRSIVATNCRENYENIEPYDNDLQHDVCDYLLTLLRFIFTDNVKIEEKTFGGIFQKLAIKSWI